MALLAIQTTWSAGDKLTATALNTEFVNIVGALTGAGSDTVKLNPSTVIISPTIFSNQAETLFVTILDSGVIDSEVATGTAPFNLDSTTKVTNLNADLLDGFDASAFPRLNQPNVFTNAQTIDEGPSNTSLLTIGDSADTLHTHLEMKVGSGAGSENRFEWVAGSDVFRHSYIQSSDSVRWMHWLNSRGSWFTYLELDTANDAFLLDTQDGWGQQNVLSTKRTRISHTASAYFATMATATFRPVWIRPQGRFGAVWTLKQVRYVYDTVGGSNSAFKVEVRDEFGVNHTINETVSNAIGGGRVIDVGAGDITIDDGEWISISTVTDGGHLGLTVMLEMDEEQLG